MTEYKLGRHGKPTKVCFKKAEVTCELLSFRTLGIGLRKNGVAKIYLKNVQKIYLEYSEGI